jgi:hypothetical protein
MRNKNQLPTYTQPQHCQPIRTSKRLKKKLCKQRPKRIPYKHYDEHNFQQAILSIQSHTMSVRKACQTFNVPRTSLRRCIQQCVSTSHLNNTQFQVERCDNQYLVHTTITIHANAQIEINVLCSSYENHMLPISTIILKSDHSGPHTIMTYEEEKAFSDWIITCSNLHIPTPKSICNQKASMILERREAKFNTKTGLPSKEWWYGFYKRWPAVAPRKPQSLSRGKALLTKEHVDAFFTDLHSLSNTVATEVSECNGTTIFKLHVY